MSISPDYYESRKNEIGHMHNTKDEIIEPWETDSKKWCHICRPGGTGRGPMQELARFYEMLLNGGELDNVRMLEPDTIDLLTQTHRTGMIDETMQHKYDWALGFACDSKHYGVNTIPYGYGKHCSERTVGHSGSQSSTAFMDPENGLVVAIVLNGRPGEPKHQHRIRGICSAIYKDLNLLN